MNRPLQMVTSQRFSSPNPEEPQALAMAIEKAKKLDADYGNWNRPQIVIVWE